MEKRTLRFQQVMTGADWVKLAILIIFWALCWLSVWWAWREPISFNDMINEAVKESVTVTQTKDGQLVKNLVGGYEVIIPNGWNIDKGDANNLSFSNKNSFTPLDMGEDGILYNIVVYKTDKNLDEWVKEKNDGLDKNIKINKQNLKINGMDSIKQRIDQSGLGVGEGSQFYTEFFVFNKNILEISNTTQTQEIDNDFERFVFSIKNIR